MAKGKKITMQEIADIVGVSKYAVSKALSGKPGISAATREKIFEAASQLGYLDQKLIKRSANNQGQADDDEKLIGILFPNIRSQNRESSYWGRVLEGVFRGLESSGIGSVLITDDSPRNFHKIMRPEALLGIIGLGLIETSMLVELRNVGIPFVLVDHEDELVSSDSVFMNNYDILRKLVKYLVGKGHTDIQFVGDWRFARSFADRWNGFKSVMAESGIPHTPNESLLRIKPTNDKENLDLIASTLAELQNSSLPTALVCANDKIASHLLRAMQPLGIRVPEDTCMTGFDNEADFMQEFPELSTVNAESEALGIKGVELLFWRLANLQMPHEKLLLQGDLIIKGSIAPPRTAVEGQRN
ncbi:substrate-binding domain-containing protein [Cohnella thailandensis]|uniref:Substrate-binding domain-containing protein n=1 Tax=Cohnella thailandensis TaxID=557557 RepID=A0A841SMQ9_9BACL|nr:substrate-binding domain-containing protein [Cohnella thailandensis]MBB6633224.1 substrate-binding domain-containing protein [Cohnella thailandensis]MBP1975080.1 LacI family transcriptional regulator [Cohnella thailandensis]